MKQILKSQHDCSIYDSDLVFNYMRLKDHKTVEDYKIEDQAHIHCVPKEERLKVEIVNYDGWRCYINVTPNTLLEDFKEILYDRTGLTPKHHSLVFRSSQT